MVEHVFRRAEQAQTIDRVVVATDDTRIADAVDSFGGTAVMTAATHETGTDRLAEVASNIDCAIVVNIQGDEPLIDADAVDAAVTLLKHRQDAGISTLRRRIDDLADLHNPAVVKIIIDRHGNAIYFSRAPIPFVRSGQPRPVDWRHLGLYAYRRDVLLKLASLPPTPLERAEGLEQLRALENGFRIVTAETTADSIGVDTPEDLERVRKLLEANAYT